MADADNNISAARRHTPTMNSAIERKQAGEHFPTVGFWGAAARTDADHAASPVFATLKYIVVDHVGHQLHRHRYYHPHHRAAPSHLWIMVRRVTYGCPLWQIGWKIREKYRGDVVAGSGWETATVPLKYQLLSKGEAGGNNETMIKSSS